MFLRFNKWFLQQFASLIDSASRIVVGLHSEPVLHQSPLTLAGDIKYFAELNVARNFGPTRIAVASQRVPTGIHAGLVVALFKLNLRNAVVGQRTSRVGLQGLLVFSERAFQISLCLELLPLQNGGLD